MTNKFKAGDLVKHECDDSDIGTFIKYVDYGLAEVKWKDAGLTHNGLRYLSLYVDNKNTEQEAVMLLLSLGYTVSKNNV